MKRFTATAAACLAGALIAFSPAFAVDETINSEVETFRVSTFISGLEHPWSIVFLPNGNALVTERDGRLRMIRDGKLVALPINNLPNIAAGGQGGLLDLSLHPNFNHNQMIYFSYSGEEEGRYGTEVARSRLNGLELTDVEVIFKAEPKTSSHNHFGSRLLFLPDGTLLITLGEKFHRMEAAQNVSNHLGSVIRIHDDGRIPQDNPFVDDENARPAIFTYGHRNIQGIALHPQTRKPWIHEHGPKGGDELNILQAGANYGWPEVTSGLNYDGSVISDKTEMDGVTPPVAEWTPSIAPSGMVFYDGDAFPGWKGNIFLGALAKRHLRRVVLEGEEVTHEEILLKDMNKRIRDVEVGPDGALYVLIDSPDGEIWRIEPVAGDQ